MKKLKYIWTLYLVLLSIGFIACNEDDKYFDKMYKIVLSQSAKFIWKTLNPPYPTEK